MATNPPILQQVSQTRNHAGLAWLDNLGLVRITGSDAATYLHNQSSNDVVNLQPGHGQANAFLNRKAGIEAFGYLYRTDEHTFWLLTEASQVPAVLQRLDAYLFSEQVVFSDESAQWKALSIQGPRAWHALLTLGQASNASTSGCGLIQRESVTIPWFSYSHTGELGIVILVSAEHQPQISQQLEDWAQQSALEANWLSPEALEVLRVEAGLPKYGVDMTLETLLPSTGLEQVAVSDTKGCYPGQEVVAKVKTYGSMPKMLTGLMFDTESPLPTLGSAISLNGTTIGEITSMVHSSTLHRPIAMAYLTREHRTPGSRLTFEANGSKYTAHTAPLPFYRAQMPAGLGQKRYDEALAAYTNGDASTAISLLREAIILNPTLLDAYEILGVILSRQGELDEAIGLMKRLAELDPDEVMAHTNLSVFYMQKGWKEAAEEEKARATVLTFRKQMNDAQRKQAEEAQKAQRLQEAQTKIGMFKEVLELDPDDHLATYGLGRIYFELDRLDEAVPLLEKAIALNPNHSVGYATLGQALTQADGQEAHAREIIQKGIEVASKRGDRMPLQTMQELLTKLDTHPLLKG